MTIRCLCLTAILVAGIGQMSMAAPVSFQAVLTSAAANSGAGTASSGFGTVFATLDDVTGDFTVTAGTFANLTGVTTSSVAGSPVHLHGVAAPNQTAGVLVALTAPVGVSLGTISGSGNVGVANIANVMAGNSYINLHTTAFTSGEIRGQLLQINAVPEPTSLSLLGVAMGSCLVYRRRRRA